MITKWECFLDAAFYDMWAVRPIGETAWGMCFHVVSEEEAVALMRLLTDNNVPTPFKSGVITPDERP